MDIKGHQASPGAALLELSSAAPGELPAVPGLLVPWGAGRIPRAPEGAPGASLVLSLCRRGGMEVLGMGTEGMLSIPAWPPDPSCRGAAEGGQRWQLLHGGLGLWDPHLVPEPFCLSICCSPELGLNCCPSLAFQEGDV